MDPYGEFAFVAIPWIIEGAEWAYAGYRAYRAYKAAKTAYDIAKSFPVYDDAGGDVCYSKERSPYPPAKRKRYPSKKEAREAAQRAGKGKKPIHHPNSPDGPHYHPDAPMPKNPTPKVPNPHDHYYYPKGK